ncbi:hypothetical protein L1049_002406 [Liquidambar formosana]|uniref:Uncharacterized protein n=1 Tax=Liquidambar formosana TaxID=63359 RepID=A0AAP0R6N6_LIQFO
MAEVKNNDEEPALHAKRKPNLTSVDKDGEPKKQKVEISDKDSSFVEDKINKEEDEVADDEEEDDDDEEEEEEDDDDDDEEEDDEDGEHSNGKAEVDHKGKGILREDKGKGKLIEEEDESDDDSSDGEGESDGDSDLSDDPLAEVDLDNILPSRTRRRVVNPAVNIANDNGSKDDDDSDDSDA